jgi:hypothetical protein
MRALTQKLILSLLLLVPTANADVIDTTSITASTSLIEMPSIASGTWSVDELTDGVISDAYPYFGFVSGVTSGVVHLALDNIYDLDSFSIWNDVNVLAEGVRDFRLDFLDAANTVVASYSGSAISQFNEQIFSFATVSGVQSVDLVVLTAAHQIEIREVAFNGNATAVPEPATLLPFAFLCALLTLASHWVRRSPTRHT